MTDGRPRPDHGEGWHDRTCATCGATWVGHDTDGDWCWWCEKRADTVTNRIRRELLYPAHLRSSSGNPVYDRLPDDSKAVWDRTRGQQAGSDTFLHWIERLVAGIETDTITDAEARAAIRRVTHDRQRSK